MEQNCVTQARSQKLKMRRQVRCLARASPHGPRPTQPSITPRSVNEDQFWLEDKGRNGSFHLWIRWYAIRQLNQ